MSLYVLAGTVSDSGTTNGPRLSSDVRRSYAYAMRLFTLASAANRTPDGIVIDVSGALALSFTPDLTTTETTQLDSLATVARISFELTPAEYANIQTDIATLKTYMGITSPTNAQTAGAVKSLIRILNAAFR